MIVKYYFMFFLILLSPFLPAQSNIAKLRWYGYRSYR